MHFILHLPPTPQTTQHPTFHNLIEAPPFNTEPRTALPKFIQIMPHEADNVQKWAEKVEHTIDPVNWSLCALGKPKAIPWADDFDFVHFNGQKKKYEITGVLAEGRGELATHPCNNCVSRYYPFGDCKIVPGHLEEACANCYYNKQACVFNTPRE